MICLIKYFHRSGLNDFGNQDQDDIKQDYNNHNQNYGNNDNKNDRNINIGKNNKNGNIGNFNNIENFSNTGNFGNIGNFDNNRKNGNIGRNYTNKNHTAGQQHQPIQFIGQTEIVPISHDHVSLQRIYNMAEERRNEYLEKHLRAKIHMYEPRAKDRAKHLLQFDLEQIVTALNDDQYLFKLIDILNDQLKYRKNWSEEQKLNQPFWWNEKNLNANDKNSKLEFEDEEKDESVEISIKLLQIPSEGSKIAFLGTKLYPKIKQQYPNQVNKLYNVCLERPIQDLQKAICDKDFLQAFLTEAQI